MQFAEGLSARRAAEAVRARIDWKYALGLELTDAGFDISVLCEFRARQVTGAAEHRLLEAFLRLLRRHPFTLAYFDFAGDEVLASRRRSSFPAA